MNTALSWDGLVRAILSVAGGFLLGRHTFIDAQLWELITGFTLSSVALVWSWFNKELKLESVQGVLRNLFVVAGAFFGALGVKIDQFVPILMASIPIISSVVYGWLSRKKSIELHAGKISTGQLKK